jgi:hypothetical protein
VFNSMILTALRDIHVGWRSAPLAGDHGNFDRRANELAAVATEQGLPFYHAGRMAVPLVLFIDPTNELISIKLARPLEARAAEAPSRPREKIVQMLVPYFESANQGCSLANSRLDLQDLVEILPSCWMSNSRIGSTSGTMQSGEAKVADDGRVQCHSFESTNP